MDLNHSGALDLGLADPAPPRSTQTAAATWFLQGLHKNFRCNSSSSCRHHNAQVCRDCKYGLDDSKIPGHRRRGWERGYGLVIDMLGVEGCPDGFGIVFPWRIIVGHDDDEFVAELLCAFGV